MSRVWGLLCRACLALAAALAALLLLPLPLPRAPAPARAPAPTPGAGLRRPPARANAPRLRPDDVFIAVKTTRKNHGRRLGLLLRTWISRAPRQVGPAPGPLRPGATAARSLTPEPPTQGCVPCVVARPQALSQRGPRAPGVHPSCSFLGARLGRVLPADTGRRP